MKQPKGGTQNRIIVISGSNMTMRTEEMAFLNDCIRDYDMVILQLEIPMAVNTHVAQLAKENGSCGQLQKGDVVIFISNSGETPEMKATVEAVSHNSCPVIGISENRDSYLSRTSDAYLFAGVIHEGDPLNRAARMSILAETLVLQTLSVYLQVHGNLTPQQYVMWHPGGMLGKLRDGE